jgi:hypothetical protein
MNAQTGISNIQTAYENNSTDLLNSVQKLTDYESDLLTQITNLAGVDNTSTGVDTSDLNNPETNKQIKKLLAEIENIEKIKTSIYNTLTTTYKLTQEQIDAIRPVVANSNVANQLMADALNVKLKQLGEQIDLHNNSERMIGVNNYYARRYEAHSSVMKKIVLFCGIIILIIFLMKIGIINDGISSVLIIATLAIGLVIVGKEVWDISRRSNIDFDKYNYPFNPDNVPARTTNVIDKKTDETYGRQWVNNICSDITKTAASVENSVAADVGYLPPDAGSGAGSGSTNTNVSSVPVPSGSVITSNDTSSSMPPSGQESFMTKLNPSYLASPNTNYNTKVQASVIPLPYNS